MQTNDAIIEQILTLMDEGADATALLKRFPDEPALVRDLLRLTSDMGHLRERLAPTKGQLTRALSALPQGKEQTAESAERTNGAHFRTWFSLPRMAPIGLGIVVAIVFGVLALQHSGNEPLPIVLVNNAANSNAPASATNSVATNGTQRPAAETPGSGQSTVNIALTNEPAATEPATNTSEADDTATLLASLPELEAENTALASDVSSLDQDASAADGVLSSVSFDEIGASLDAVGAS